MKRSILFPCFIVGMALCVDQVSADHPSGKVPIQLSPLVIDTFDVGPTEGAYSKRTTTVGAFHGTYAKHPSSARMTKSEQHRRGNRGSGLVIEWDQGSGWCGYYTLLKDGNNEPVDASAYNSLSFWIKGEQGGESFEIGFTDKDMAERELDAYVAGPLENFIPSPLPAQWTQVKVPLRLVEAHVDLTEMGSLVFNFREEGKGTIYVEDIEFVFDPDLAKKEATHLAVAKKEGGFPRSLWVWKIDPVRNLRKRKELFETCKKTAIEIIYLYFDDLNGKEKAYYDSVAEFNRQCHKRNIQIESLTGDPTWALEKNHRKTLKWIKGFLDFNQNRPAEERFDGTSLDIEPYLAAEWKSEKQRIKDDYIQLLQKCRKLIDHYDHEFHFGVAVPMAYEQEEPIDQFQTRIFELVDNVALMAYYDTAKKIIQNSVFFVDLATKMEKKLWIGVETQDVITMKQGNKNNTFWDEGWAGMENVLADVHDQFKTNAGYGGIAMHCLYSYRLLPKRRNVATKERSLPKNSDAYRVVGSIAKDAMKMDGSLDDWNRNEPFMIRDKDNVVYQSSAWRDAEDLSVKTYCAHTPSNLYFAFEVADDVIVQEKGGTDMWEGDHIEFWLDVDLPSDYTVAVNGADDIQFGFSPGNFDTLPPEVIVFTPEIEPERVTHIEIASKKTEIGYNLEVRIPAEFLRHQTIGHDVSDPSLRAERFNLRAGVLMGISIDPSDCDSIDVPQKCLMSSSTDRVWGDPTTFGFLELK